ncbi:MAG: ATP synthase F1 subunit epsilon [Clostridiales bacterium]
MSFYVEIMTPEKIFFTGEIDSLVLKTIEGEMGILSNHIPMVVTVDVGTLKIKQDDEWLEAFLSEGFVEIKNNKAIILVDTAEWPHEINVNRANEAKKRAEERLLRKLNHLEYIRSKSAVNRAIERLKVSKKDL